ncbi:PDZ domain-containing protein [Amedibacillus dolichus]|uniref:PDZ domain-containing protein n=1 Tax=Amedibacillus dolichus TaxID=31971 RepID=A0A415PDB2_9FIRM|nr:trypsin-like peptidase domain-containing protein [Amedibacillus dolichus]RHM10566.1 PDZ domain-containing protein [Amedibacillus dolichus]
MEDKQVNNNETNETIILGEYTNTNDKNKEPKPKRDSFFKTHKNAVLISTCVALSALGAFGGTMLAIQLNGGMGKAVLYQSVDTSKNKNNNATATNVSITDIANETMDSVVEIKTESVSTHSFFQQAIVSGAGSGVILSKDGYIVTNHHVIDGASKITVTTRSGKSFEAKLIGSDSATDLAVLKIEAEDLQPAVLGDSSKLNVGDTAVAIGNPLGSLGGTVTSGIISALDREVTIDNQKMQLLQTNAAINPGNSGGGLFNANGELIGIVNAKSSGNSIEGLGFAIPINRAKEIINNLIENGYVKGRASLGVTLVNGSDSFFEEDTTQVYIYEVSKGGAADKAGLKRGDQILKIDDTSIKDISDVTTIISNHSAGDTIKMTVLRDTQTKTITVTLGEASNTNNADAAQNAPQNNNRQ